MRRKCHLKSPGSLTRARAQVGDQQGMRGELVPKHLGALLQWCRFVAFRSCAAELEVGISPNTLDRFEGFADLFDSDYILSFASQAYSSELDGERLVLNENDARPIVDKIEEALQEKGVEKFNKGRMAKLILRDLGGKSIEELDESARRNFELVFAAVNSIHSSWTQTSGEGDKKEE